MRPHLRVFASDTATIDTQEPSIRVSLGDLLPLLALAERRNYVWLRDFLDDEVFITSDLYEILQSFRVRPSA